MNWKTWVNPFSRYPESTLFLIGIFAFLLLNVLCSLFQMKMDGILHYTFANQNTWWEILLQNTEVIGLTLLVLCILAFLYNKKTRIIDVVNAVLVSCIAQVFLIAISGIPFFQESSLRLAKAAATPERIMENKTDLMVVLVFSCLLVPFLVYSVVLLYHGFRTATNMKSWQQISVFFIVLFVLNLISQLYFF